jgi:hypothetical protein
MDKIKTTEMLGVITHLARRPWGLQLLMRDPECSRLLTVNYEMSETDSTYSSLRSGITVKVQMQEEVFLLVTTYKGVGEITIIVDPTY